MINILFPMGGKSIFFDSPEYIFPKPLIEIYDNPIIQLVIENFNAIQDPKRFIFVVNAEDCTKFHLDNVLKLLTDNQCHVVKLSNGTKGAACSALMAIEYIDNETPLVIANSDQIIEENFNKVINCFDGRNADAGVICFESVHPRWSYVRLDEKGTIAETAEKCPISKHAIAGFYYFRQGKEFVRAAMRSIGKDSNVNGLYYIAPTLNELVLENKNLQIYQIDNEKYHTFYSPQKIKEYKQRTGGC